MNRTLALLFCLTLNSSLTASDTRPAAGVGQLGASVSWIGVPGSAELFYMAQRTRDGRLILTPNEAFFPQTGLVANGSGTVKDIDNLNGGKSFATIEKWDAGDVAEWGLFLEARGELTVRVWMSAAGPQGRFVVQLGNTQKPIATQKPVATQDSNGKPVLVAAATVDIDRPGQHILKLICEKPAGASALHWIEVSGAAANDGAVLRKRWRPAAAHTKFSSSAAPDDVRLWVMEMDAVPGDLGFYSPITTPFGYYGPTWRADGTVNSGFNFSLWSFGRGKPEPPVEQLSHLLAIGNRQASFGGFDHEGTGVKIRNWEPLAGRQGQRQVIALRVKPGEPYDTYFSYFYAADKRRWQLFGVGNKYSRGKPLQSLWVGSFVEVPGPPHVQRTGPYPRVMRYRGWVMDASGEWHPLDQMTNGNVNRMTGLTHTDRGLTDDDWFYLQTGGWTFRKATQQSHVRSRPRQRLRPDYLRAEDVAFLKTVPSEITASAIKRERNRLRGTFRIRNVGQAAEAIVFHGTGEGLTFADRWPRQQTIRSPREGDNTFSIDDIADDKPSCVRLLLKNHEGQFWSPRTIKVEPAAP